MNKFDQDEKWMFYALKEADKAFNLDEVPIGSVIVNNNRIIGRGFNQIESLKDSTAHAEIIAITSASNSIGDWRLNNCSIYVTKEPCIMCIGAIINARIEKVYYGISDIENGFRLGENSIKSKYSHLKYIKGNILKEESKKIIQDFFLKKR